MNVSKLILSTVLILILLTAFDNSRISSKPSRMLGGISIANASIAEGNNGQRNVEFMIILSQASKDPVAISYTTKDASATAGSDYVAAQGTIGFAPGDRMKKITIAVIGDVGCERNETFDIILNSPSGAILTDSIGTSTIVNDDCMEGNLSFYEVRLTYKGYTTFAGTPADCPIRSNGNVVLSGIVSGNERVVSADDIKYTGDLQLEINIDICSSKLIEEPGGGYRHAV